MARLCKLAVSGTRVAYKPLRTRSRARVAPTCWANPEHDRLRSMDLSGAVEHWYNVAYEEDASIDTFVSRDCQLVDANTGKVFKGAKDVKDAAMQFKHKFVACSLCGHGADVDLDTQRVEAHWFCFSQASIDCDGDPTHGSDIFTFDADGKIKRIEVNITNPETMSA